MKPRQYSRVKFNMKYYYDGYPFTKDGVYIFLGEIPNMRDHCVVIDYRTGIAYSGYHTDNFYEWTGDE